MADDPPIFGAKERAALVALLWNESDGLGFPITAGQLAERSEIFSEELWGPNTQLLSTSTRMGRDIQDGGR